MANRSMVPWGRKRDSEMEVRREQDPFLRIQDEMDRMFNSFFDRSSGLSRMDDLQGFAPTLDVYETDKEIKVDVELPGMNEKDIDITVGNNVLTISGRRETEDTQKGKSFYRHERSFGSFRRSIELPEEVDEDNIDATYSRGVLKITLPKTQQSVSMRKKIQIKKG